MQNIKELLIEEMRDTKCILTGLEKMAKAASSAALKQGFETHRQETQVQIDRLVRAFGLLDAAPGDNTCEATQRLLAEADEIIGEDLPSELLDVALVMAAQKVEHYEIAAYGSLATIARGCGEKEIADLLAETLEEEIVTDETLTALAESEINPAAFEASAAVAA